MAGNLIGRYRSLSAIGPHYRSKILIYNVQYNKTDVIYQIFKNSICGVILMDAGFLLYRPVSC